LRINNIFGLTFLSMDKSKSWAHDAHKCTECEPFLKMDL
jgi:hypothetical protein